MYICVMNDHGYVPLVGSISRSSPHACLITEFVTRVTWWVSLVEQEGTALPENLCWLPILSLIFCVLFCRSLLYFRPFLVYVFLSYLLLRLLLLIITSIPTYYYVYSCLLLRLVLLIITSSPTYYYVFSYLLLRIFLLIITSSPTYYYVFYLLLRLLLLIITSFPTY
jgi:hypothetical protein